MFTEKLKKSLTVIFAVLFVAGAISTVYLYGQLADLKKNPQRVADEQAKALVAEVAKIVALPEGETPTVATVADPEKLKDQPFFANAKTGYNILIYTTAKKAYMYDPVEKRIVDIAPINIGAQAAAADSKAAATTTAPKVPAPAPVKK